MAVRTEAELWALERERVAARLSVAERVALWFAPRSRPAEPCPFEWFSTADLIPIPEENQ